MANGVPVRLSPALTTRARAAAATQERSLTEQVEHWARLGQVVEEAILVATSQHLKMRSHDPDLASRLALATTAAGQAKAAQWIHQRNPVRHGVGDDGRIRVARSGRKRLKKG